MKNTKFNISLLFVEDEEEARNSVKEMIGRRIADFYVASNAAEALEIFDKYKPEVVLSDIKMPGMNGLKMVEKMKQINPQLKTIMMTAFTDTDFLLEAIALQVDGYITKPIFKSRLLAAIEKQADIILLEKKVEKQKLDLIESNKTKDKFFSIIAHDLKSPFNSLLGFAELLNDGFDDYDEDDKRKFIGIIYDGLHNTFKLLDDLLYWARSQKGTIDYFPEKINLFLITKEISELLTQSFEKKSIKLINQIALDSFVFADRDMLATIIRNLLTNAMKFTNKHGEVIIKNFSLSDEKQKQFVGICVSDTGVGIPVEIQSTLFDIGKNVSTSGTEKEKGTGLGLILCKEFVEKHGGKIWVESEVGKGSEFCFLMPIPLLE